MPPCPQTDLLDKCKFLNTNSSSYHVLARAGSLDSSASTEFDDVLCESVCSELTDCASFAVFTSSIGCFVSLISSRASLSPSSVIGFSVSHFSQVPDPISSCARRCSCCAVLVLHSMEAYWSGQMYFQSQRSKRKLREQ